MHPSQAISRQQMQTFDAVSGRTQGLTYSENSMMYLRRRGALLMIDCYINGKHSHYPDMGYVHATVMNTWDKIAKKALTPAK